MLKRVAEYLRKRARDPVAWMAAFFIGPWGLAAIFGWSPILVVNATFFAAALAEWGAVAAWVWRERSLSSEVLAELRPPSDRWKLGWLMAVGAVTLLIELWLDSVAPGFGGVAVTLFGISSFITGWYAWSRSILIARSGLIIGASLVPWHEVQRVSRDGDLVRIDFGRPHHFYGVKLRVAATEEEERTLLSLVPDTSALVLHRSGGGTA
jgi:hypothetical protein